MNSIPGSWILAIVIMTTATLILSGIAHSADEEPGRPEYTIKRRTEKIVIDGADKTNTINVIK